MSHLLDLNSAIKVKTALKVLSPGMYTARYMGCQMQDHQAGVSSTNVSIPLAFSQAPIQMEGEITFVSPEHVTDRILSTPGDYLLVNVKGGEAILAVSKYTPKALIEKVDVHWRLEPLDQPSPKKHAATDIQPMASQTTNKVSDVQLTLKGHIERQGDVQADTGEWLGSPEGQARLEGFQIAWKHQPATVTVMAVCKAGQESLQIKNDQFLGTRQKATPITELAVFLDGTDAHQYHVHGEAAFSDGSRHWLGETKAVAGSNGSYLVAVRLLITPNQFETVPTQIEARSRWLDPKTTTIRQR